MVSANSSTSAGGLASAATGMRPTRCGASHAIARRSVCTRRPTSGRCTLTTTSSPVCRRAAWTWAIEAAASGVAVERGEHRPPAAGRARPRRCARTSSNGSAGTWSRQRLNSSTSSGGNRPSPDEMIWPSLMNVGPSASAASRRRRDSSAVPAGPSARPRLRRHDPRHHGARQAGGDDDARGGPAAAGAGVISSGTCCGGEPAQLLGVGRPRDRVAVEHPRRVVGERAPLEIGWSASSAIQDGGVGAPVPPDRRRARHAVVRSAGDGGESPRRSRRPGARLAAEEPPVAAVRAGRRVQVRRRRRVRVGAVPRPPRHDDRQRRPAHDRRGVRRPRPSSGSCSATRCRWRCGSRPAAGWATASARSGCS